MHIDTFEQETDPKILDQGRKYFAEGRVTGLISERNGSYAAYNKRLSERYRQLILLQEKMPVTEVTTRKFADCSGALAKIWARRVCVT